MMLLANCSTLPRTADFLRSPLIQAWRLHAFANNIIEWAHPSPKSMLWQYSSTSDSRELEEESSHEDDVVRIDLAKNVSFNLSELVN